LPGLVKVVHQDCDTAFLRKDSAQMLSKFEQYTSVKRLRYRRSLITNAPLALNLQQSVHRSLKSSRELISKKAALPLHESKEPVFVCLARGQHRPLSDLRVRGAGYFGIDEELP